MKHLNKNREIGEFEYFGKIVIPKQNGVKIKSMSPMDMGVKRATSLACKKADSPKNFTEILKTGSRKYLELALFMSLLINFLTFLIFVCIYIK